jgi:hypothetical protein
MKSKNTEIAIYSLSYLVLPECMLECFDIVDVEETSLSKPDPLMRSVIPLYLDEKDIRTEHEKQTLRPNGFTEVKQF